MNPFLRQFQFENRLFFRARVNVFWNFLIPLFFLLLFGSLNFGGSINYTLPGILVMALFSSCVISTGISYSLMREKGYYRRMKTVPVNRPLLLSAQILQRFFVVICQILFLIAISLGIFSASFAYLKPEIFLLVSVGIFTFLSFGFLLANVTRSVEMTQIVTLLAFFILLFLGGAFWPVSMMPGVFQAIAKFFPTPYLITGIQDVVMIDAGILDLGKIFLMLFIWGGVSLALAIKFFRWE